MNLEQLSGAEQQTLTALLQKLGPTVEKTARGKRKQQKPPEYLTEDEIARFFAAIPKANVRDRALFELVYRHGLRASEPGIHRFEDFRQSAKRMFIRRLKGSRGGEYRMVEAEFKAMKAWAKKRGNQPGPLFPSRNRKPIGRVRIYQLMRQYCLAAGIPSEKAHPHAMKHSCGTHLSAREKDIAMVQDWLGHADIRNTMKYVQVSSRRREEFSERLDQEGWGRQDGVS